MHRFAKNRQWWRCCLGLSFHDEGTVMCHHSVTRIHETVREASYHSAELTCLHWTTCPPPLLTIDMLRISLSLLLGTISGVRKMEEGSRTIMWPLELVGCGWKACMPSFFFANKGRVVKRRPRVHASVALPNPYSTQQCG